MKRWSTGSNCFESYVPGSKLMRCLRRKYWFSGSVGDRRSDAASCAAVLHDAGNRGSQHGRARQDGGGRDRHPIAGAAPQSLDPVVEGRAPSPGGHNQGLDERFGSPRRRQAVLSRCALPDIAEPHLSRRNCSQGPIPSGRTPASIARSGMRFRRSSPAIPPSAIPALARTSRACSPGCCLIATGTA
jgi:hypothetical protein